MMCVFVSCVENRCQSHVRWLPSRRLHMARSRACCAAPTPTPRSDLDLRRSRLLATTAVAHLLKPANSHGRAIMNSWLVPAQTGVSAVNLRNPIIHTTPRPSAFVEGTAHSRTACRGDWRACPARVLMVHSAHSARVRAVTLRTLASVASVPPYLKTICIAFWLFAGQDSKLQFSATSVECSC